MNEHIERAKIITEALPYISRYRGKTLVIKYGGNAMNDPAIIRTILEDVATLKVVGVNPVLVHGGGPEINSLLTRLNVPTHTVGGLRVTDGDTMEAVQMALAGKVNKNIVGMLGTLGVKAIGLCGKDGNLIEAEKMPSKNGVDYGYVGKIKRVNTHILDLLASDEYIPVIATIGTDSEGNSYNINADTAAGAIGGAMKAEKLMYLTDIDGLRADEKDPSSLIAEITCTRVREMIESGSIAGGMIPKAMSCVDAVEHGAKNVLIINGTIPHSILLELFTDSGIGTMVTA